MSRAIFVALFYVILHFQYVDVYQRSDYETVGHYFQKRQFHAPAETKFVKVKTEEVHGNVTKVVAEVTKPNVTKSEDRNVTAVNTTVDVAVTKEFGRLPHEHNGALFRSFYVFLGLSVIVLLYISFRTFKVRPGAPPSGTVRKYGIVGRRSDMEMQPLPLNEDDDDDNTLFDAAKQPQQIP